MSARHGRRARPPTSAHIDRIKHLFLHITGAATYNSSHRPIQSSLLAVSCSIAGRMSNQLVVSLLLPDSPSSPRPHPFDSTQMLKARLLVTGYRVPAHHGRCNRELPNHLRRGWSQSADTGRVEKGRSFSF